MDLVRVISLGPNSSIRIIMSKLSPLINEWFYATSKKHLNQSRLGLKFVEDEFEIAYTTTKD